MYDTERYEQDEANEHLRRGVYTDVNDPRKAQFNEVLRCRFSVSLVVFAAAVNHKRTV